jgi:hypothetical protein
MDGLAPVSGVREGVWPHASPYRSENDWSNRAMTAEQAAMVR